MIRLLPINHIESRAFKNIRKVINICTQSLLWHTSVYLAKNTVFDGCQGGQFAGVTPPGRVRLMSFYLLAQFCLKAYESWLLHHTLKNASFR